MAVRKPELRHRARSLREQGWTLRRIANDLGVALSTASLWVRDIPAPAVVALPIDVSEVGASLDAEVAVERRRCGNCQQDLPLTSFNRHPGGRQWWCRHCFRAYFRARGQRHLSQVRSARQRRREDARAFVAAYLRTQRCSDCGEADPRVLDFHHLNDKRGNVTDMVRAGSSVRALERELAKCIVVCASCHRVRTASSEGSWRLDPGSLDQNARLTAGERRNMTYLRDLLMQAECVDCGDARLLVLEFDHVGEKTANVTDLARRGCSLRRLEREVSRCMVRCANCHRRRTSLLSAAEAG